MDSGREARTKSTCQNKYIEGYKKYFLLQNLSFATETKIETKKKTDLCCANVESHNIQLVEGKLKDDQPKLAFSFIKCTVY